MIARVGTERFCIWLQELALKSIFCSSSEQNRSERHRCAEFRFSREVRMIRIHFVQHGASWALFRSSFWKPQQVQEVCETWTMTMQLLWQNNTRPLSQHFWQISSLSKPPRTYTQRTRSKDIQRNRPIFLDVLSQTSHHSQKVEAHQPRHVIWTLGSVLRRTECALTALSATADSAQLALGSDGYRRDTSSLLQVEHCISKWYSTPA